ncbi:hypothetical protein G2W53_028953 [Senna tora]|uniref:Uncharacterized protein n=1 Tax=Senna tora TaxID=362788 RepID=A0A834WF98_9FABA|nr:hypothetical protein G2W53_028953 [Senna tora]
MGWLEEALARTARLRMRFFKLEGGSSDMRLYLNTLSPTPYLPARPSSCSLMVMFMGMLSYLYEPCGLGLAALAVSDGGLVEACGSHEVVVLGFLVCGDKYSEALANVDIKRVVVVLDGIPCLQGVDNLILAITFCVFAIHEDTIGSAERSATVQVLLESGVGLGVPVTHKNVELYYLECEKHDAEPLIVPLLLSLI